MSAIRLVGHGRARWAAFGYVIQGYVAKVVFKAVFKMCSTHTAGAYGRSGKLSWGNGVGEIRTHGTRKGTLVFKFARRVFV